MNSTLLISPFDMQLLHNLFTHDDAVSPLDVAEREALAVKLQSAQILPEDMLPSPSVVGLHDVVSVQDLSSKPPDRFEFKLVLPHESNFEDDHISLLSPLGSAVFGMSAGTDVTFESPAGPQKLRVLAVSKKAVTH